ncbi:MAG TPA: pantoate--beta-alanine ligase [Ignavibacteriales bacterium]|nr:pantoate--beta-alanine ligase [Ignavibacteriales bacterium]HOL81444.1 pantoate--beta-alanine ligase [Ignavibacteriales bacterium]HOM65342.1 pantoate--beta-alanine ligase [Ignavibacteriales bacterium]HPD66970.1 pantoate--beta-alanine ligase [Ignavibacteriales bacterium]HPP33629.1 pantoate--beta-alanine ligase [Ignavibacteriales bacterium]
MSQIKVIKTIKEMHNFSNKLKKQGKKIGFVPTMGYLHEGHLSLVRKAKEYTDTVIVSIFVNPTQFAPNEDFNQYPRDFQRDLNLLETEQVVAVFYPTAEEMYSKTFQTYVENIEASRILEGEFRPTHFRGVTTVVTMLFNCVKPDLAIFGQKDAQQAFIIDKMVKDLKFDIDIIISPIIREADGLAMSSRNIYLSPVEREEATILYKSLNLAKELISQGERSTSNIINKMENLISTVKSSKLDYIAIVSKEDFKKVEYLGKNNSYFILIACRIGKTRLIDNIIINI